MSLRALREKRNMTRRELADISGVSFRTIQDYEQRHKSLASAKGETLYRFARVLDCTVEELLEDEPLTLEISGADDRRTLRRLQLYDRLFAERSADTGSREDKQRNTEFNAFVCALLARSTERMNDYINGISEKFCGCCDAGGAEPGAAHPEGFYSGFVLGLTAELAGRYRFTFGREDGPGCCGVMMEPLNEDDFAFILEFKGFHAGRENSLEDTVAAAHAQIRSRDYRQVLIDRGIAPARICSYAFAFRGKQVLIG